jgi:hypothetical protein
MATALVTQFARRGKVRAALASLGIFPVAYSTVPHARKVPLVDLLITCPSLRRRARFHPSSGLYGFVDIPPGPHRLRIEDPTGRWLSRDVMATVRNELALRRQLAGAQIPPTPEREALDVAPAVAPVVVLMRPSPAMAETRGTTRLLGSVVHPDGSPAAFARIEAAGEHGTWTTWSDPSGGFLLALPHESAVPVADPDTEPASGDPADDGLGDPAPSGAPVPVSIPTVSVHMRAWSPKARAGVRPLDAFVPPFDELASPTDIQQIVSTDAAFVEHYASPAVTRQLNLEVGALNRLANHLPITISS